MTANALVTKKNLTNGNGRLHAASELLDEVTITNPGTALKSKPSKAKLAPETGMKQIVLPELDIRVIQITLIGDSGLICNKWSEKAKQQMRDKQMKNAKTAKTAKVPEQDFQASLYKDEDGDYAFPTIAFKAAAVDACSHVDGITKVEARGAFHIEGEFAKIHGTPEMREDMVRVGMGTADLRYRGEYKKWYTTLTVRYNKNVLSDSQIANLFNTAGFAIGVGEWRPAKDGRNGMFHVARDSDRKMLADLQKASKGKKAVKAKK